MEHFYHFFSYERAKKKDKHLSAISWCLLNITKGPCARANVPKMKSKDAGDDTKWGRRKEGRRHCSAAGLAYTLPCCCFVLYFHLFLLGVSFNFFLSCLSYSFLLLLSYFWPCASLKDNSINAGNLNGRAQ